MTFFQELTSNQTLMTGVTGGWSPGAQDDSGHRLNHSFNPERLVGSGGMPSSHSSTVCSLATAAALRYGVGSFEFAISFVLSMIVMYDAMGVRRETGKQAKLLNLIMEQDWFNLNNQEIQKRLKEFCGFITTASGSRGRCAWASFWHLWCTRVIYKLR